MNLTRWAHACSYYNKEVWVAGGYNDELGGLSTVEIFSPFINSWRRGPDMNAVRWFLTMQVLDDEIVIFGGYVENGPQDTFERWNGEVWIVGQSNCAHGDHTSVTISCL